jgi:hypothetical protein
MHYMTRRSSRMQKHKFCIMCPNALFIEIAPGLVDREKRCVDISHPGRTGMHCATRRFHLMQKYNLGIMCPDPLFMETTPSPPVHEK